MKVHIETKRLILRDFEPSDAQGIFDLDSDPDVMEFLGKKTMTSLEEAEKIVDHISRQYKDYGIGRWAIIDKKTNEFVGWTGLRYEQNLRPDRIYYDLGYRLKKKFWGKGIASETALLSIDYGFKKLNLKEICACADVLNVASNHILLKSGLEFIETFEYNGILHNWYSIKSPVNSRK